MRFESIEATRFGPLRDRQFELDSDVVLVFGPNEAGKSTFRSALETILFGFKPADRDQHPLARWDEAGALQGALQIEAHLRLDTDEILGVERVLLQSGKSRISTGRSAFAGPKRGNACLAQVSWLSREVFAALYSLEFEQLRSLDSRVRADVDELLLPARAGLPLRPLSEVRAELRRAHTELWRPDKRGKPRARQLRKSLSEARAEASRAGDAERELRLARAEREEREATLADLRERKRELERVHNDSPLLAELFEHRRRTRELGPAIDLAPLGEYSLVRPSQLRREIAELEDRLRVPRARLEPPPVGFDAQQRAVLDREAEIETALGARVSWESELRRRADAVEAARSRRARALERLASVCASGADAATLEVAGSIPRTALRAANARWTEQLEEFAAAGATRADRVRGWALALGCAGLVAVALASLAESPMLANWGWDRLPLLRDPRAAPLGGLLMFVGLVAALFAKPSRRVAAPGAPEELTELLRPLELSDALFASPTAADRLVDALDAVAASLFEARDAERQAEEIGTAIDAQQRRWSSLCAELELEAAADGELALGRLRAALTAARRQRDRVAEDTAQRDEATRLLERDAPLLAGRREHADRLAATLVGPGGDSARLDEAYDRVIAQREEANFLRRREQAFHADARYLALLEDSRVEADRPDPAWSRAASAAREQQIAALEDQLGREQRRLGELDELLGSDSGSGQARAMDRVREIEGELAAVETERDRLALLESIVARAEREFREAHQPDVLRRASRYLERISDGRYCRIDLVDDSSGALCVTRAGRERPVEAAHPLSQGTLDQIFLCLRLGLLDHLDEDRERLPLVLDDALLRMDDRRRRAAYRVLGEIAPQRQIFLLTCHAAIAEEIGDALKVQRIDL